jgi:Flp pilus assembly protein protease CpaA
MRASEVYALATFAVALLAAAFDWRLGRIPNALTYAALLVALPLHAYLSPHGRALEGIQWAAFGGLACGLPLVVSFWLGWVAGGDVKLITAMGALGGISSGLEAVFLALLSASGFVFIRLCYRGVFLRTVTNGFAVAAARTLHRGASVEPRAELTTTLRFGPFALAGASLSLAIHGGLI